MRGRLGDWRTSGREGQTFRLPGGDYAIVHSDPVRHTYTLERTRRLFKGTYLVRTAHQLVSEMRSEG